MNYIIRLFSGLVTRQPLYHPLPDFTESVVVINPIEIQMSSPGKKKLCSFNNNNNNLSQLSRKDKQLRCGFSFHFTESSTREKAIYISSVIPSGRFVVSRKSLFSSVRVVTRRRMNSSRIFSLSFCQKFKYAQIL